MGSNEEGDFTTDFHLFALMGRGKGLRAPGKWEDFTTKITKVTKGEGEQGMTWMDPAYILW